MSDTQKLIEEYPLDYCEFLEAAYGDGMMSEGGNEAIDSMLEGVELESKKILDIGSGLGGSATHVAAKHCANVIGIDINQPMINLANSRIPANLKSNLNFLCYDPPTLPFADDSFDVVYSKGVLVHVKDKLPLFQEVRRVLKPGGVFLIDDWLSPVADRWCDDVQTMCDLENLTLYAQTEEHYYGVLKGAGFKDLEMRPENKNYTRYNQDIVERLKTAKVKQLFVERFSEKDWREAVEAYQLITNAIRNDELLIRWFKSFV